MNDQTSNGRVDLRVPFPEKDEAKALGARWDPDRRTWFVPPGADPNRFKRWSSDPAPLDSEPSAGTRVNLDVPFDEKDEAKSKGARWDPAAKRWFAPPGIDLKPLQAWIPGTGENLTELIPPIFVVESATLCWKCNQVTPVGTIASESFIEPDDDGARHPADSYLYVFSGITYLPQEAQNEIRKVNPGYRHRYSKTAGGKYFMNHCPCGAQLGDFYMHSEPGGAFFPMTKEAAASISLRCISEARRLKIAGSAGQMVPNLIEIYARRER